MEADISILRKTGHFYFALTRAIHLRARCESHNHFRVALGYHVIGGKSWRVRRGREDLRN